jgi:hypothetical protein
VVTVEWCVALVPPDTNKPVTNNATKTSVTMAITRHAANDNRPRCAERFSAQSSP